MFSAQERLLARVAGLQTCLVGADQVRAAGAGPPEEAVIRTPDRRVRVFVSSTLGELAEERRAVARAISALRLTPVMFELGARPYPPREVYQQYLAQSDVFIGLYWQRYGQPAPRGGCPYRCRYESDEHIALRQVLLVHLPRRGTRFEHHRGEPQSAEIARATARRSSASSWNSPNTRTRRSRSPDDRLSGGPAGAART